MLAMFLSIEFDNCCFALVGIEGEFVEKRSIVGSLALREARQGKVQTVD